MVYLYSRILTDNEKDLHTNAHYVVDKHFRKHYAKWKEPVTKAYILYDSIYIKCPE